MCNTGQMQSLCAGSAKSWIWFISRALNIPGYHLAIVRSGLVGHSVVWFGYNLVSCTLSGLSHESGSRTGIRPMTHPPNYGLSTVSIPQENQEKMLGLRTEEGMHVAAMEHTLFTMGTTSSTQQ